MESLLFGDGIILVFNFIYSSLSAILSLFHFLALLMKDEESAAFEEPKIDIVNAEVATIPMMMTHKSNVVFKPPTFFS